MAITTSTAANETYTLCEDGRYLIYEQYTDTNYSTVDSLKNITVDSTQINITQEENSQYIPFRMPRYWDGIDLMNMLIQIHYLNKNGDSGVSTAVNVMSSENYISFGWLIELSVTAVPGSLTFEITAIGSNEKGNTYKWRSRPNGKLTVLEALSYDTIISPSTDWYTSFETTMIAYVNQAAEYAATAQEMAESVSIDTIVNTVEESVRSDLDDRVTTALADYYTQDQIDAMLEVIHSLTNLKVTYDNTTGDLVFTDVVDDSTSTNIATVNINSLSNLKVTYSVTSGVGSLTFADGDNELMTVDIGNTDPSADWTAAYTETVEGMISEATSGLQDSVDSLTTTVGTLETTVTELTTEVDTLNTTVSDMDESITSAVNTATTASNDVAVLTAEVSNYSEDISSLNTAVSELSNTVDNLNVTSNVYDVSYENETFTFYENDEIKQQFIITGGSGGSSDTSVITIERVTDADYVVLSDDTALIEYNFSSVDNTGDSTGSATGVWKVGSTTVATSTVVQGYNSFDITSYLTTGSNTVRLTVTDSFGSVSAKTWTVTVVEFKLESSFDDSLFYSADVTFRYTPYGSISKDVIFILDGTQIASVTTSVTGRQLTQTIPTQTHGSHLLEVYMTATINDQEVQSASIYKDIIWVDTSETAPIVGCSTESFTAKQYNTTVLTYVVYDPSNNPATIVLTVDGETVSTQTVDRTAQTWSYKATTAGTHILTITCGETVKTITATIEELEIDVSPVTTNLELDFNPTGKSNNDADWLTIDDNYKITVSDNFDTTNGGYQTDDEGDTYFCVKSGTTATIPYQLFADDAKKNGKNFKLIFKTTNVKDYDATALTCLSNNIGLTVNAQQATLYSELDSVVAYYCEDEYIELEFNILPDSEYTEMVMWLDAIPVRVKLYASSDSFTQTSAVGITIGSDDCDVWVYRMKAYSMNLTDDEILDNFIADAKNADEMIDRYNRNQIVDASGELDPDLIAEVHPELRILKVSCSRFTTGKKDYIDDTTIQHIYNGGRTVEDNWTATGRINVQGTSSVQYWDAGANFDFNATGGFTFSDGSTSDTYALTENSVPVSYFNTKLNIASSENVNNMFLAKEYNQFNPYTRTAKANDSRVRDTMELYSCVVFLQETDTANATVFTDGQWHFYGCGDFGNSKKNDAAMGMDADNHKECIIEVDNNTDDQTRFLSDDLTNEGWDGDNSFEFRYISDDCTDEEVQACKDAWQRVLTWVVNADAETFVKEFEDYFIKDSVLFFYLFTLRHTMIDNRAKNTFWHTEDLLHWDICFDYDNDKKCVVVKPLLIYGETPETDHAWESSSISIYNCPQRLNVEGFIKAA